jgi:mannosyltransferase
MEEMINVLIDGCLYGWQAHGGIKRCFDELIRRIAENENDIQFTIVLPEQLRSLPPKGENIRHVMNWRHGIAGAVQRTVNRHRVACLEAPIFHSTYYTLPFHPAMRSVATVHDFIHERYAGAMRYGHMLPDSKIEVLRQADRVVAVSDQTKQDAIRYAEIPEGRIRTIYHGATQKPLPRDKAGEKIRAFKERYGLARDYWLYVGRRELYKNFDVLLKAWAGCRDLNREMDLVTIGPAANLESRQFAHLVKHGLEEKIHIIDDCDDADLSAAYAGATGLVYPSLCEGFGIPLLEAMAAGCPVVVSDIPVFKEVAQDSALYFDPHSEEQLVQVMRQTMVSTTRTTLIEKGLARVRRFSWDQSATELATIYREVAAMPRVPIEA